MTEPDPANYPWWLASRSAGIVAFVLIASAVILGLVLASRFSWPPGMKRKVVKVHQQIALAGLVAIGAHGVLLARRQLPQPGRHRDHDSLHPELSAGMDRARHPRWLPGARARTDLLRSAPHRCPPLEAHPPGHRARLRPGGLALARFGNRRGKPLVHGHGRWQRCADPCSAPPPLRASYAGAPARSAPGRMSRRIERLEGRHRRAPLWFNLAVVRWGIVGAANGAARDQGHRDRSGIQGLDRVDLCGRIARRSDWSAD